MISGWVDRGSDKQVGHNPVPSIGTLSCHVPAGATLASVMLRLLVLYSGTAEPAPLAVSDAGWGEHSNVLPSLRVQCGVYSELGLAAEGWMLCNEVTLSKNLLEQI